MPIDKDSNQFKLIFYGVMFVIAVFLFFSIGSLGFTQFIGLPLENTTPWTAYLYWQEYSEIPKIKKAIMYSHSLSAAIVFLFVVIFFKPAQLSLYGNAKWAKEGDLAKAEPSLRSKKGIVLGKFKGKYVIQGGQQFTLVAAPTRSGKGVSLVIPNCLNWHDSLVVTDIKLENYKITSGFRKEMGQDVYLFNPSPRDYKTHRWNPLSYISKDKNFRVDDIQKIASFLIPTPKGVDPMWSSSGRSLFMGVVLMLLDQDELPVTIGEVYRQLSTEKESSDYFKSILLSRSKKLDPLCVMSLNKYINLPPKQREGVKSTLDTAIDLWANPLLDAATSTNDFNFCDLRKKRMTIYVGITPDNLDRLAPVLNLFFQQLVDQNTKELPEKDKEPYTALLLMDEFPAMGKMETISKGVSYIAGYNLRLMPIIQSPAQLIDIYGREGAENFIENIASRVVFAPKHMKQATEIADELGNITVKSKSISKPREMGKGLGSTTISDTKRQLLLPQEVKDIGQGSEIILSENCRPVMAKKISYFKDNGFLTRCVDKSNLKAARKSTTQEEFISLAKTPANVPTVVVLPHTIRGLKDKCFDLDFDSVKLPETTDKPLTDDQISAVAEDFMSMLAGASA